MRIWDILSGKRVTALGSIASIYSIIPTSLLSGIFGWLIGSATPMVEWLGEEASLGVAFLTCFILLTITFSFSKFLVKEKKPQLVDQVDSFTTAMDMTRWVNCTGELMTAYIHPFPFIRLTESPRPGLKALRVLEPDRKRLKELLGRVREGSLGEDGGDVPTFSKQVLDRLDRFYVHYGFENPPMSPRNVEIVARLDPDSSIDLLFKLDSTEYAEGIWMRYIDGHEPKGGVEESVIAGHSRILTFGREIVSDLKPDSDWKRIRFEPSKHLKAMGAKLCFVRLSGGVTLSHWGIS